MTHEAVLELAVRARDLSAGALADAGAGFGKLATSAGAAAGRIQGAFSGMGRALSNAFGNAIENIAQGGDLTPTLITAGAYMAGQLAENFGGSLIEKIAGSSIIGAITAPLAALGSTIGSIVAAAIPIGMALLPALLIAALVAAVTILIVNEDIRNKVIGFVGGVVETITSTLSKLLGGLPELIGSLFGAAWSFVIDSLVPFIVEMVKLWFTLPFRLAGLGLEILNTIVRGLSGLPGKVADIIGDAFRSLSIDIGPFHIRGGGITIDLPRIDLPHFAEGVVGFRGGLAVVGEKGPELVRLPRGSDVIPNGAFAGAGTPMPGVFIQGVSQSDILDMVDRGLMFRLQRAAPTRVRG